MAKLSVEQRAQIRTWLREQLTSDPDHRRDDEDVSKALDFEVTRSQVQAAYRDIFALSPGDEQRVQQWLRENWGRTRVDGYESDVSWRVHRVACFARIMTNVLGIHVTKTHIEDASKSIGKEWATLEDYPARTYWAHNEDADGYYLGDSTLRGWTDAPRPTASLTITKGANAEDLRKFLHSMLDQIEELIANVDLTQDGDEEQAEEAEAETVTA